MGRNLTEPGLNVRAGDYLLAVDGRDLRLPMQPGELLIDRAGKQTVLSPKTPPSLPHPKRRVARLASKGIWVLSVSQ